MRRNWRCLVDGLRALGFVTVLADEVAAPVIATFHQPADPNYDRERFFEALWRRGFVMFRGSLTPFPTFRIGCMGAFDREVMAAVVRAVGEAMAEMAVTDRQPAPPQVVRPNAAGTAGIVCRLPLVAPRGQRRWKPSGRTALPARFGHGRECSVTGCRTAGRQRR